MKLLIRQRIFSWTDSYDVCDEWGVPRYEVKGKLFSLGHQIHVYDKKTGREVGSIHEKLFRLMPQFEIVINGCTMGTIRKEFTLFKPRYHIDYKNWDVEGDFFGWDYAVSNGRQRILSVSKEIFNWSDTYVLCYNEMENEIPGLLLVLAIDAANCSENK